MTRKKKPSKEKLWWHHNETPEEAQKPSIAQPPSEPIVPVSDAVAGDLPRPMSRIQRAGARPPSSMGNRPGTSMGGRPTTARAAPPRLKRKEMGEVDAQVRNYCMFYLDWVYLKTSDIFLEIFLPPLEKY